MGSSQIEFTRISGWRFLLRIRNLNAHAQFIYSVMDLNCSVVSNLLPDCDIVPGYVRGAFSSEQTAEKRTVSRFYLALLLLLEDHIYKDILAYDFLTDPSLDNCLIPKMTLQPLVENAIYHGIKPKRGISRITISSSRDGDRVLLNVADSGIGMGPEALQKLRESLERDEGSGFGMKASYKRLRLMFGSDLGFDIESTENRGTEITIRIPYQTEVSA